MLRFISYCVMSCFITNYAGGAQDEKAQNESAHKGNALGVEVARNDLHEGSPDFFPESVDLKLGGEHRKAALERMHATESGEVFFVLFGPTGEKTVPLEINAERLAEKFREATRDEKFKLDDIKELNQVKSKFRSSKWTRGGSWDEEFEKGSRSIDSIKERLREHFTFVEGGKEKGQEHVLYFDTKAHKVPVLKLLQLAVEKGKIAPTLKEGSMPTFIGMGIHIDGELRILPVAIVFPGRYGAPEGYLETNSAGTFFRGMTIGMPHFLLSEDTVGLYGVPSTLGEIGASASRWPDKTLHPQDMRIARHDIHVYNLSFAASKFMPGFFVNYVTHLAKQSTSRKRKLAQLEETFRFFKPFDGKALELPVMQRIARSSDTFFRAYNEWGDHKADTGFYNKVLKTFPNNGVYHFEHPSLRFTYPQKDSQFAHRYAGDCEQLTTFMMYLLAPEGKTKDKGEREDDVTFSDIEDLLRDIMPRPFFTNVYVPYLRTIELDQLFVDSPDPESDLGKLKAKLESLKKSDS